MKNKHLQLTFKVLEATELSLAEARVRDAFIKDLVDNLKTLDENRLKIVKKLADKDEKGEAIIEDNNYKVTDREALIKELEILAEELSPIVISEAVKKLITESNYKPKIGEAAEIDEILK